MDRKWCWNTFTQFLVCFISTWYFRVLTLLGNSNNRNVNLYFTKPLPTLNQDVARNESQTKTNMHILEKLSRHKGNFLIRKTNILCSCFTCQNSLGQWTKQPQHYVRHAGPASTWSRLFMGNHPKHSKKLEKEVKSFLVDAVRGQTCSTAKSAQLTFHESRTNKILSFISTLRI